MAGRIVQILKGDPESRCNFMLIKMQQGLLFNRVDEAGNENDLCDFSLEETEINSFLADMFTTVMRNSG